MAEFYKFEITNWNEGTANLSLELEAAYLRVINAIRLADQPITFNTFVLCGLWRCNDRKAKRILAELIDAGKIYIEDGRLVAAWSPTALATDDRPAIPKFLAETVRLRDGNLCAYCGDTLGPFEIDHIIPWALGGGHDPENLTVACRSCNRSKGSKPLEVWMAIQ